MKFNPIPTLDDESVQRFWSKTKPSGDCVIWTDWIDAGGYGRFKAGGKRLKAHRIAYTLAHGEIPEGMVIDHLCRVRNCVNPDHLDLVTQRTNVRRGLLYQGRDMVCAKGHAIVGENRMRNRDSVRCRICFRDYMRARRLISDFQPKTGGTCKSGHEFTAENTLTYGASRQCRTCRNLRQRERRLRLKAA